MIKSKKQYVLLLTGFVLIMQHHILKMTKVIKQSSTWDWGYDTSAMLLLLGTILIIAGLIISYKKQKENKNEKNYEN